VPSAHDVGKTFIAAVAVNWWYDTRDPGVVITTAPTLRDVVDLLWTEVRLQRFRVGLESAFVGPAAPQMGDRPDHYAKGFTARRGESFQGRHRENMLFVMDEANGIDLIYWLTTRTMFDPDLGHAWLAIFNPTDTTTAAYQEDQEALDPDGNIRWHRFRLSALDHPNVLAGLRGEPKPIRGAVSKEMVDSWIADWCDPIDPADRTELDIEWPPGSGNWFKPGPIMQCRGMGLWPAQGAGIWSDPLWEVISRAIEPAFPLTHLPVIGCDCATGKGDDCVAIHDRWGEASLGHESSNTMDPEKLFNRLIARADYLASLVNRARPVTHAPCLPRDIPINIDDDATGNAVTAFLRTRGYNVHPIGAGTRAKREFSYPNKRSELWFEVRDRAKVGLVNVSRLDRRTQRRLKRQLMAPTWELRGEMRVVEPKQDTKEKIGRSPDDADAFNLAYYDMAEYEAAKTIDTPRRPMGPQPGERRGPFRR
jgi:hypothetical protein